MIEYSEDQVRAIEQVNEWKDSWGDPMRQTLTMGGYAGSGKTTLISKFFKEWEGVKVAALCGKAAHVLRKKGVEAQTIHRLIYAPIQDERGRTKFVLKVVLPDTKVLIIDECFTKETLIDTPSGPRKIESIRPGDSVYNAFGVGVVVATKKTEKDRAIKIIAGTTSFFCSENHPFFTRRGYVRAIDIRPGDSLVRTSSAMRLLREEHNSDEDEKRGLKKILRSEVQSGLEYEIQRRIQNEKAGEEQKVWFGKESVFEFWLGRGQKANREDSEIEPNRQERGSRQIIQFAERSAIPGETRRQWSRANQSSIIITDRFRRRVEAGISGAIGADSRLPDLLQNRSCRSSQENRHRSGWTWPQIGKGEGERPEESREIEFVRVDRVEVLEQGHPGLDQFRDAEGKLYFYDLQVDGHPSFSVGGCLVHNSSMVNCRLDEDLRSFDLPILYVGDHGQLEPIGDNPHLMANPEIRLEKIHRQAAGNPILRYAAAVREGRPVPRQWRSNEGELTLDTREAFWNAVETEDDWQFICGYNKTRHDVNKMRRLRKDYKDVLEVGDNVICLKNNYDFMIFNGMQAVVRKIYSKRGSTIDMQIETDDGEIKELECLKRQFGRNVEKDHMNNEIALFDYGDCLTGHKSQGSEMPRVAVLQEIASMWDPRRWSYTAATRASETLLYCT